MERRSLSPDPADAGPILDGWRSSWIEPQTPSGRIKTPPAGSGLLTFADAVKRAAEIVENYEAEQAAIKAAREVVEQGGPVLFGAVADAWLVERRADVADEHLKMSSLRDYESMLKRPTDKARTRARKTDDGEARRKPTAWIRSAFDARPIAEIDLAEIGQFEKSMRDAGLSIRTRTKYMTVLNMIFEYARTDPAQRVIERNPLTDRPKAKRTRKRKTVPKFYAADVVEKIAALADDPFGDMIRLAALTGLRQGELLALRWRNVDFAGRKLTVEKTYGGADVGEDDPKSGAARSVPMSDQAGAVLDRISRRDEWTADDDLVFGEKDGNLRKGRPYTWVNIDGSTVRRAYAKARDKMIEKADDPKPPVLNFHALRHIFGSSCAMAGVPLSTLQVWMGHEDITTTQIYVHFVPQHDDADRLTRAQTVGSPAEAVTAGAAR